VNSLRTKILGTDGGGEILEMEMHRRPDMPPGGVMYTEPFRVLVPRIEPMVNEAYGNAMNQDISFGGTPELINDGGDTAGWTGNNVIGNDVDFTSTDRPETGSASVEINNPDVNDVWEFDKGSDLTTADYTAVTMSINIDKNWAGGDDIGLYAYDQGSASQIGNEVSIGDYVNEGDFDVWQQAIIPFSDLGLVVTDFDTFRMVNNARNGKKSPRFFIDNFYIQQTGTPAEFRTNSPPGQNYYIDEIIFTFVDALDTTLADASMNNLSYDQILGVTGLSNGFLLRRFVDGEATISAPLSSLSEFIRAGFETTNIGSDGTNTYLTLSLKFPNPLVVYGGVNSYISATISENLSGLVVANAVCRGNLEWRDGDRH